MDKLEYHLVLSLLILLICPEIIYIGQYHASTRILLVIVKRSCTIYTCLLNVFINQDIKITKEYFLDWVHKKKSNLYKLGKWEGKKEEFT